MANAYRTLINNINIINFTVAIHIPKANQKHLNISNNNLF